MMLRLLPLLLLLLASLPVAARDVKMSGANGDGGTCPDQLTASIDEAAVARATRRATGTILPRAEKPAASRGADSETAVRPPRWHSFLPGMFR